MPFAIRRAGCIWKSVRAWSLTLARAAIELEGRAGEVEFDGATIRWRIASRRSGSAAQRLDTGMSVSTRIRWVRLFGCGTGSRATGFSPLAWRAAVKLQDFFTNQKVPRDRRRQLIVAATADGEVFWVEGLRISERFKLTKQTIRRLQWRWERL